jgi:nitrogen fixation protein NifB
MSDRGAVGEDILKISPFFSFPYSLVIGKEKAMSFVVANNPLITNSLNPTIRVAVASKGTGIVDQHFGHAQQFFIYEVDGGQSKLVEQRSIPRYCHGKDGEAGDLSQIIALLTDCTAILVARIGSNPEGRLQQAGIEVVQVYDKIETALADFYNQWITKRE